MRPLATFFWTDEELIIRPTWLGEEELAEGATFEDLIEWQVCNGWESTTADTIGCLSSAPVLVYGSVEALQTGEYEPDWYYYPDYQVRLEEDDLKRSGMVVYKRGY